MQQTRRRKSLTLALTLIAAQACAVAGMIGTAALIDGDGAGLERDLERPIVAEAQAAPEPPCRRCDDPLRLILF